MGLILFYAAATLTLFASFGVVATRNIVHAALFLLAALAGVAGLFVLLYAEFLALVQLLIYGGAIIIVILFALMLTRSGEYEGETETRRRPFAAVAAALLFGLMTAVFVADAEQFNTNTRQAIPFRTLAEDLFAAWAVPFEIASLVLLVALIGAVVIGRAGREEDETLPEDDGPDDAQEPVRRGSRRRAERRRRGV
ncbi:MAG: NADH-quinone oxidoreductase subunit J [Chloroflexi bacterium]|nr:NADH-quinone oxidoreductase subunit J [Chloroflexota bacterium]MYB84816.1 NADH-quinone oxidoreductase subunit J [Chloroflexota bacterium]MYK34847.1 NADH-quinone oxidoreductase subunit J [Chloroflexota bacterium]